MKVVRPYKSNERILNQLTKWRSPERRKKGYKISNWSEGVRKAFGVRNINETQVHKREEWRLIVYICCIYHTI